MIDYLVLALILREFFEAARVGLDVTNHAILTGAWIAQIAISSGAYYWKSKAENLVKLPIYMLRELPRDMREKADPNQIISAIMGIGTNNNNS